MATTRSVPLVIKIFCEIAQNFGKNEFTEPLNRDEDEKERLTQRQSSTTRGRDQELSAESEPRRDVGCLIHQKKKKKLLDRWSPSRWRSSRASGAVPRSPRARSTPRAWCPSCPPPLHLPLHHLLRGMRWSWRCPLMRGCTGSSCGRAWRSSSSTTTSATSRYSWRATASRPTNSCSTYGAPNSKYPLPPLLFIFYILFYYVLFLFFISLLVFLRMSNSIILTRNIIYYSIHD